MIYAVISICWFGKLCDSYLFVVLQLHIWKLKDSNCPYNITWNVVKHATPFRSGAKTCGLCLAEKLQIMQAKPGPLLNKRSELVSKCRHKAKFLLKNIV